MISQHTSDLYAAFGDLLSAAQLERTLLRAFRDWTTSANINVGVVKDNGAPFGTYAPTQMASGFGDIRVGAAPLSPDVFAISIKNDDLAAGSWAGDIIFNSAANFTSVRQFYSVALHEVGHTLGLEHSANPRSAMNPNFAGTKPAPSDMARLKELYGPRSLDAYDVGNKNNDSLLEATDIKNSGSLKGSIPLVVYGDINRRADDDYFKLDPLSNYNGEIKFRVITRGISMLTPRLSVYNEQGKLVGRSSSLNPRGADISVSIAHAKKGETYFARVDAKANNSQSIGSYALVATFEDNVTIAPKRVNEVALGDYAFARQSEVQQLFLGDGTANFNDDLHTDDTLLTATHLRTIPGFAQATRYRYEAGLSDRRDVDNYRIEAPDAGLLTTGVMTVNLDTLQRDRLIAKADVFDESGKRLASKILVNGVGELVLQVAGIQAKSRYFIRVAAAERGTGFDTGNYRLNVAFDRPLVRLQNFGTGTLTARDTEQFQTLYVAESQLFHLSLKVNASQPVDGAALWATVYDEDGAVVYRVAAKPGETRSSQSVILRPGTYVTRISVASETGAAGSSLQGGKKLLYRVQGIGISNPQGPEIIDPTIQPFHFCEPGSNVYCYPNDIMTSNTFVWVGESTVVPPAPTAPTPPYVNPAIWYWAEYQYWGVTAVPVLSTQNQYWLDYQQWLASQTP